MILWLLACAAPGQGDSAEDPLPQTPEAFVLGPVRACQTPVDLSYNEVSASLGLRGPSEPPSLRGESGGTLLEDLNGDGHLDLIYGPGFGSWLHYGTGPAAFGPGEELPFEGGLAIQEAGVQQLLLGQDALYAVDLAAWEFGVLAESDQGQLRAPSVADFNGDGWLDLYLAAGHPNDAAGRMDRVLWGSAEGWTVEDAELLDPARPGEAFDSVVLDMDQDGYPDLYVANDRGPQRGGNRLYRGGPDGLSLVTDCGSCGLAHSPMGAAAGDLNGDGWVDLLLASTAQNEVLFGGPDGRFVQAPASLGHTGFVKDSMGWGGVIADVNNDGRPDLWVAAGDQSHEGGSFGVPEERPYLHLQNEQGGFEEVALELGLDSVGSWRSTLAHDLNEDGVLDLWLSSAFEAPRLWLSAGCTEASWLEVEAPPMSRVEVHTAQGVHTAWVTRESSFQSVQPAVAHIGLGDAEVVDQVVVDLPLGGGRFVLAELQPRRRITLSP